MSKKISWVSVAYLFLMTFLIGQKVYHFFSPHSQLNMYYAILRAFDIVFYIPYILTLMQVIFNVLSLIPLFLFIFHIDFLPKTFWKYFITFNVIFDLTGHSYQVNEIIGIFHTAPRLALTIFLSSVIPYFPKYVACLEYAFSPKFVFKK